LRVDARPVPRDEAVRRRMSAQARHGTGPEMALRSALHRRGLRFRLHRRPLADLRREADLVFRGARVAVFVDGCFWHSCPQHGTAPATNRDWWQHKLETNRTRDRDTDVRLQETGWTPARVWEHELPHEAADRIEALVRGPKFGA